MRSFYLILFFFLLTTLAQAQPRRVVSFSEGWTFRLNAPWYSYRSDAPDSGFAPVQIPHTWNGNDALDEHRGYAQTTGWYRKRFKLFKDRSRRYIVRFGAASQRSKVWLNGQPLGSHFGGYTAFQYDVTDYLIDGINTLTAAVSNAPTDAMAPISADFTFYGGLTRDVWLITTDARAHFAFDTLGSDGVWAEGAGVSGSAASLRVFGKIATSPSRPKGEGVNTNSLSIKALLQSPAKGVALSFTLKPNKAGKFDFTAPSIKNPLLWSPQAPNLYSLNLYLTTGRDTLDALEMSVGFRYFKYTADSGFFLNGKPCHLRGACRHQDHAGLGNALPDAIHERDMRLLKDMGANFFRAAHYPHHPAILRACDRLGIVVWAEIPVVNTVVPLDSFTLTSERQMRELIAQQRQHPAVCIWGLMNEALLQMRGQGPTADTVNARQTRATVALAKRLNAIAHTTDQGRLTALAAHFNQRYNTSGLADVPDVFGWNLYFGWYHDRLEALGTFLDAEHTKYPKRRLLLSEYGVGSDLRINSRAPEQYDFSNQYMLRYHTIYNRVLSTRPWVGGQAIWNLADFGSEGRRETMPSINNKGMLTFDRRAKDIYHYYKALWTLPPTQNSNSLASPVLHLALADWPHRYQAGPAETDTIQAFTNLPGAVELFIDGKPQGRRQSEQGSVTRTWVQPLPVGKHLLEVRGAGGERDQLMVDVRPRPQPNVDNLSYTPLCINIGAAFEYYDGDADEIYLPDQPYKPGVNSWGYVGGKVYRQGRNRVGIQERIDWTHHQPLYQTMRDSLQAYHIEAVPGTYRLELMLTEPRRVAAPTVYELAPAERAKAMDGYRLFDVAVNGQTVLERFPEGFAAQQAVRKVVEVKVRGNEGIAVTFPNCTGGAVLSAIRLERVR